jgi:DNA-binding cell septation regulator SpoVG
MSERVTIASAQLVLASEADRASGLLFYASLTLAPIRVRIDGVTIRRKRNGDPGVSWPSRRSADGRLHPIVQVLDAAVRAEIEDLLLDEARKRERNLRP